MAIIEPSYETLCDANISGSFSPEAAEEPKPIRGFTPDAVFARQARLLSSQHQGIQLVHVLRARGPLG